MMDNRKTELTMEMMENAAGGGWEQFIPYGMEILNKVMNSGGGSDNNPAPASSEPGYTQDNSNNSGAQQNVQGDYNSNTGGLNVTR